MEHTGISFDNRVIWKLSENVWITETIYNTWWIMALLTVFAIYTGYRIKRFTDVPNSTFQNIIEFIVDTFDNFVKTTLGKEYAYLGNWFFGVFVFIFCSNYSELFGVRPPTTDLATTVALALVTFVLIHGMGIWKSRSHYFKEYFTPMPVFFPIHLIEAVAIPISLSFRLFGNILGGFIILGMIYHLFPWYLLIVTPAPLHFFLDVFVGALQAFIFTILSMTFIKVRLPQH